jgi:hypothetical protein
MKRLSLALVVTMLTHLPTARAQDLSSDDLASRAIHRRAVEAVIWGMPAVKQYWSATAYDRQTHALIVGMSRPSLASNNTAVQKNPDGSTDIYFGPTAPAGKASNWVPTEPKRQFEVLFRLYGPKKELFEKIWKLPDVEEEK